MRLRKQMPASTVIQHRQQGASRQGRRWMPIRPPLVRQGWKEDGNRRKQRPYSCLEAGQVRRHGRIPQDLRRAV